MAFPQKGTTRTDDEFKHDEFNQKLCFASQAIFVTSLSQGRRFAQFNSKFIFKDFYDETVLNTGNKCN